MGTAGYMAPEQARGQSDHIDARSDIYAVGAVLFRAMSGRRVHERNTAFDMTIAAMRDPAPSLATVMPSAPPGLVRAIDRALAFDSAQRWQSAKEMFEALRAAYDELPGAGPASQASDIPLSYESDGPSLVVDVAFGADHEEAVARERERTREVIDVLSSLSIVVDSKD
jgi:serine/threonine-protein kinase